MAWMRTLAAALAIGGAEAASGAEPGGHGGYEGPPYSIERAEGAIELRSYAPHLVAEVTVEGDRSAAVLRGFRVLAGYIFGGNAEGREIAMTVPVAQSPALPGGGLVGSVRAAETGPWTVRFMMPADFRPDTLPAANDGRIRFVTTPAERQIVARFSGIPTTGAFDSHAEALRGWAASWGLTITDGPHLYYYDDPMTLPWNRRNEVAFGVR